MLACRDLVVEYSSDGYLARPIDGLSLDVGDGELALLLGASGCGKTTLLSVFAGILRPTAGSVRLDEIELNGLEGRELNDYRRTKVGIVFQAFNLIPSLTAAENIQVPLLAAGYGWKAARARAEELLERVALADRSRYHPPDLSGGQQQRVAIARSLALDPPLLLADEPTAHLDYIQVESVLVLLRTIADSGRTVIVSTHDDRLMALADRVVNLSPRAPEKGLEQRDLRLSPGDVLFAQGDVGDLVYLVEEGNVEIVRLRSDGTEELLDRVGPGGYFGELAPMFGLRRAGTARAVTDAAVLGVSLAEFRRRFGVSRTRANVQ
jgi:putative ABC transport system ATP-binding protein